MLDAGVGANSANLGTILQENIRKCVGVVRAPAVRMTATPEQVEELTEKVIGCAIEVHRILGPGLLESVYRECLIIELRRQDLRADSERMVCFFDEESPGLLLSCPKARFVNSKRPPGDVPALSTA